MRDRKYLDQAPKFPCASCGRDAQLAAHIRTGLEGGTGLKPGDDLTEWLCHTCHMSQENSIGAVWWFENIRKDATALSPEEWLETVYKPKRRKAYEVWEAQRA